MASAFCYLSISLLASNPELSQYNKLYSLAEATATVSSLSAFCGISLVLWGAINNSSKVSELKQIMTTLVILESLVMLCSGLIIYFSSNSNYVGTTIAVGFGFWYAVWLLSASFFTLASGVFLIKVKYMTFSIVGMIFAFASGIIAIFLTFHNVLWYAFYGHYTNSTPIFPLMLLPLSLLIVAVHILSKRNISAY